MSQNLQKHIYLFVFFDLNILLQNEVPLNKLKFSVCKGVNCDNRKVHVILVKDIHLDAARDWY